MPNDEIKDIEEVNEVEESGGFGGFTEGEASEEKVTRETLNAAFEELKEEQKRVEKIDFRERVRNELLKTHVIVDDPLTPDVLRTNITSDGETADYYVLPPNATQIQDLISFKNMNAQVGEMFRALYRYGQCSHSDPIREIKKVIFYGQAELERLEKYGNNK